MIENSLKSYKNKCFECLCNIFYDLSTVYFLIMSMVGQAHRDICSFTTISMDKRDRLRRKAEIRIFRKIHSNKPDWQQNSFFKYSFYSFHFILVGTFFFIFFFQNLKIAQHILFYIFFAVEIIRHGQDWKSLYSIEWSG